MRLMLNRSWTTPLCALALAAVGCAADSCAPSTKPPATQQAQAGLRSVVFHGMCDASGAVVLGGSRFAVGDDEDNVLRVYDSGGGEPLYMIDVSPALDLPHKKKTPEADIEAATRFEDHALWLTSHGRNSKGQLQPGRLRFFATTAPAEGSHLTPVGVPYQGLLEDLLGDAELARFQLAEASELAPKAGGVNIEGMTRRVGGEGVLIGFRNPRPGGKALVVPLLNPLALVREHDAERARLGTPQLVDLGGLGVRSLSQWRGRYLVIAGAMDQEAPSRLFVWDGADRVQLIADAPLTGFNPEAFVSHDDSEDVLLLSDDGSVEVDGEPCKKLKDRRRKQFRGVWVHVSP
ncbi:MAG: DUF3616 domain-containing protein [Polyangiales bacterium]